MRAEKVEHALNDGEDFELILSMPSGEAERLLADTDAKVPLTKIGVVVSSYQEIRSQTGGAVKTILPKGYIH